VKNRIEVLLVSVLFLWPASADDLPPGVPREVNPDGSLAYLDLRFTTKAFQEDALRLVIQEANQVARDLDLPERLPIAEASLIHSFVGPFGFTYMEKAVGNVTTTNYSYAVGRGYKFSDLTINNLDGRCLAYRRRYQVPVTQLDTNTPYQLATQWLATLRMDVQALNAECEVQTEIDRYWNDLKPGEEFTKTNATFVPIYFVSWLSTNRAEEFRGKAQVHLFLPTKTLLQLDVMDAKYILRPSLVFTNLAALFPGQATVATNWPKPPKVIDCSKQRPPVSEERKSPN
jgi:hypothetical protein